MAHWLHFVGRSYYPTPNDFCSEAAKIGVNRRCSLGHLKRLSWGDTIVLAMAEAGSKAIVFGWFTIDRVSITGDVAEIFDHYIPMTKLKETGKSGAMVSRRCGSYTVGPSYIMTDAPSLYLIGHNLVNSDKPSIGGKLNKVAPFILHDQPFSPGFREIDFPAMRAAVKNVDSDEAIPSIAGKHHRIFSCDTLPAAIARKKIVQLYDYKLARIRHGKTEKT